MQSQSYKYKLCTVNVTEDTIGFQSQASWVTYSQLQDFFLVSDYLAKTTQVISMCTFKKQLFMLVLSEMFW